MKTLLLILLLTLSQVVIAQKLSDGEKEILMLQDQRSLGNGKLIAYLSHADEKLRYRAAIALANIQDTTTVESLFPSLVDKSSLVRSAAAFALGQIGSARAEDSLLSALNHETDTAVFGRIAEAIGRCGTEKALLALVEHQIRPEVESSRDQMALAVSRFALRQIKTDRAIWFCFDQLTNNNASVRWSALISLWRAAPLRVIDIEVAKRFTDLQKLVDDLSPDVRMHFATLLGKVPVKEATDLLLSLSQAEQKRNEWRVQVHIVRAIGALVVSDTQLLPDFLSYLQSLNDHVVVATLQVLATLPPAIVSDYSEKTNLETTLVTLSNAARRADLVRGEALVALGRHFPDKVNTSLLIDLRSSLRLKSKVLEALSYRPSLETFKLFLQYLDDDSVRVVMAAWDFFRRTASPFAVREYMMQDASLENAHSLLYEKIRSALNRKDMAITTLVANAVGDTAFFTFFSGTEFEDKVRNELVNAYEKLSSPDDTEAMQAVLEAIGKIGTRQHVPMLEQALQDPDRTVGVFAAAALKRITGQEYSDKLPASTKATYSDYDWQTLESLSPSHTAVVITAKGSFTIQLLKEHAPFTVLTIVKLSRKGFYNGLNFHRVVPNFVIQGGDPRGDGWGGPGFAIRSESSLVNYERGMAGIASAGKDTEGCQFFVVHSLQPHLDGRYSIFAKVVQGMDVIDNIQVGDTIVKIEIGK